MHQIVQAAIDAANQGDNNKAIGIIKEVLSANPNDVDAWLVLAAIVDHPERKRQCLNRVLSLEPTNKIAREELLEMDRAAMGGAPPFIPESGADALKNAPVSQMQPQPAMSISNPAELKRLSQSPAPAPTQAIRVNFPGSAPVVPRPETTPKLRTEKPLVFKYSTITRIATYFFAVLFSCSFLLALQDPRNLLIPCGAFFLILPAVWIVSAQVEVSEKGIHTSRLFGLAGSQVSWEGIAGIKSNSVQQNLQLTTKEGGMIKITSQVTGYPKIVEMLRRKRPDLFGAAPAPASSGNSYSSHYQSSPSTGYRSSASASSFSGTRTFSKSFFKQYGILLIVIPFCFFAVWIAMTEPQNRVGALLAAGFCGIMIILPFFQVSSIKVEPDKLTIATMFEEKAFSALEVKEIKMQSVRGRYGRITNYVNIILANRKNYPIQGFSEGDEIIYGVLMNWWNAYQNR